MSGGWGGRFGHDGNDCVIAINGNCRFNPTEVFETRFPLRVEELRDGHRIPAAPASGAAASASSVCCHITSPDHRQPMHRPPRGQARGRFSAASGGKAGGSLIQKAGSDRVEDRHGALRQGLEQQIRQHQLRARRPHPAVDAGRRRLRQPSGARPRQVVEDVAEGYVSEAAARDFYGAGSG